MNPFELEQIGPYTVTRFVAEGGMSWVYEVQDINFPDRHLALKMLKPAAAAGDEFRRFEAEARLQALFNHPNLLTVFDSGRDESTGCYYYTMTFVDGPTLSHRGQLSVDEAAPIFLDVLSGLRKLHEAGIVHRDIKPANIYVTSDGRALLGDLGIARTGEASGLTRTGMAIGTVLFMSPEQARGQQVGVTSDLFSLGLSLFEVLAGKSVYEGVEGVDTLTGESILFYLGGLAHTGRQIDFHFPDEVPEPIRQVILRACRREPSERFQSAHEMRDALEAALRGPLPPEAIVGWSSTRVALGVAVLVVVAGAVWFTSRLVGTMIDTGAVEELAQQVSELELGAADLLETSGSLVPPPEGSVVQATRQEIGVAQTFHTRGLDRLDARDIEGALASLELAASSYRQSCASLLSGDLEVRAEASAREATERVAEVVSTGPKELTPAEMSPRKWERLQGELAALAAPPESAGPCDAAQMQLARLSASAEVKSLVLAIELDMRSAWPDLARSKREEAVAALDQARGEVVDVLDYEVALEHGRTALANGDAASEREQYLEARQSYTRALEAFGEAAAMAPAARARAGLRALQRKVASRGLKEPSTVARVVAEAEVAWQERRWPVAFEAYGQATTLIKNLIRDAEQSSAALAAANAAEKARAQALAEGANRARPVEMSSADDIMAVATEALEQERYAAATHRFGEAQRIYEAAVSGARKALGEAREAHEAARRARDRAYEAGSGSCAGLSDSAQVSCQEAEQALEVAEAALAARDATTARASFKVATERFAKVLQLQESWVKNRPQPPYLIAREPKGQSLRFYSDEAVTLSVEASDPNPEDVLRYSWTANGAEMQESSSRFTYRGGRDALIKVTVRDGRGGEFSEEWKLVRRNRKPTLALTPTESSIRVDVGDAVAFAMQTGDPDGDPVESAFLVDGKRVAKGERYRFEAKKPGTFQVLARVTDRGGAKRELTRTITVQKSAEQRAREQEAAEKKERLPEQRRREQELKLAEQRRREQEKKLAAQQQQQQQQRQEQQQQDADATRREEERMLAEARQRAEEEAAEKRRLEDEKRLAALKAVEKQAPAVSPENAALQVLAEYEAAYEARDIRRLKSVWVMNPQQQSSMQGMFESMSKIKLDIQPKGVQIQDRIASIDFDQVLEATGPRGMARGESKMTATLIPMGNGDWMISSILPRN